MVQTRRKKLSPIEAAKKFIVEEKDPANLIKLFIIVP